MRITVTEEHIRNGQKCTPEACPISLALQEATGKPARTGWIYCTVGFGSPESEVVTMPVEAQHFAELFDGGEPVQPFSFDLPLEVDGSAAHPQVDESH